MTTNTENSVYARTGRKIVNALADFNVPVSFAGAYSGASVTQYMLQPGFVERAGNKTKVSVAKIASYTNDLALALAVPAVRVFPEGGAIAVEVPNKNRKPVSLAAMLNMTAFKMFKGELPIVLGETVRGEPLLADLAKAPHLLIAGATGSGKSVCVNSILVTLLATLSPDRLRLLLIDPKVVELSIYNGIPHLMRPVITESDAAIAALAGLVAEMERRYSVLSAASVRNIIDYNRKRPAAKLSYVVAVVDECADLMMAGGKEVESSIVRLAQKARAVGIHIVLATQRPSVQVITGLIKANFPTRIAFAVASQTDSRVILDSNGAEGLLGRGDALYQPGDAPGLIRAQGAFVSDSQVAKLVKALRQ